ncbi:MAG: recombination protein RecR, partial [Clostridia bacterium]|nr:recombination protein RecR [Clostridia bacterium]
METNQIEPIARLINMFSKLPGVGKKTAERYAYHIIKGKREEAVEFAESLVAYKDKICFCEVCGNFTEKSPCEACEKHTYDTICVVKEPKDVSAIEKAHVFSGAYHVLHGTISPMNGVGPNDIRIKELLSRISSGDVKEV